MAIGKWLARVCAAGLVMGLLAACAQPSLTWQKAGVDDDQRWLEIQACRDWARARANADESERFHARAIDAEGLDRDDLQAVERRLLEADYLRFRDRLFGQCMTAKGYRRITQERQSA